MKSKLLLVAVLLLLPFAAFANQEGEVLLTQSGMLFTVDTEWAADHHEVAVLIDRHAE